MLTWIWILLEINCGQNVLYLFFHAELGTIVFEVNQKLNIHVFFSIRALYMIQNE